MEKSSLSDHFRCRLIRARHGVVQSKQTETKLETECVSNMTSEYKKSFMAGMTSNSKGYDHQYIKQDEI